MIVAQSAARPPAIRRALEKNHIWERFTMGKSGETRRIAIGRGWMLATLVAAVVVGIGVTHAAAQSSLDEVLAEKAATIAVSNYTPIMIVEADGTVTGISPEIDQAVLQRMGVETVNSSVVEYSALIPAVQAKRVTFASGAALYITPERCASVAFSEPVLCLAESFILRKDLEGKVSTYKDVAEQGLRIALCGGCVYEQAALDAGVAQENIVYWPDKESGMKMLQDGRVDVLAVDMLGALDSQNKSDQPELTVVVQAIDLPLYCTGAIFHQDNTDLRDAYNEGLAQVIEDGTYAAILEKYGVGQLAAVRTGTTEGYCSGN